MLPRPLRVTRSPEHREVSRRGRRAVSGTLTVHLLTTAGPSDEPLPSRAGLVVGKVVGNAVARHRVSRRLRHLLADRLPSLPAGTLVVVRAGAGAVSADLAAELSAALGRASRGTRGRRVRL